MSDKAFKRLLIGGVVLMGLLIGLAFVSRAEAQTGGILTHPVWVADAPAAGTWIPTLRKAATDTTNDGIRAIECVANTETKFVAYWYKKGAGTDKHKWPIFGVGVADTCYTVPAGETRTYLFDKPWVQFIIVTSGDAIFAGE